MADLKKFGKSALNIIRAVAPTVATGLLGPMAGMVTKVLTDTMGTEDTGEIEQLLLAGDPGALAKLKESENALAIRMRELDIEEEQLHSEDRKSARAMTDKTGILPQLMLTFLAIAAFGAVLYVLVLKAAIIPPENKDLVIFLVGQLSTFVGMGFTFFLGSSKGSKDKVSHPGNYQ